MATQVTLPALGENIESGDVLSLLVSEGDVVAKDQDLLEIETDKATVPVPSPQAGKIVKILVSEGDTVAVGGPILELEAVEAGSAAPPAADNPPAAAQPADTQPSTSPPPPAPSTPAPTAERPAPAAPAPTPAAAPVAAPSAAAGAAPAAPATHAPDTPGDGYAAAAAGPAVRRLARQLGVELRRVRPSSSSGRITQDDVRQHVRAAQQATNDRASQGIQPPGAPSSDDGGAIHREKMSRMRQTIARNMTLSYTTIPQLTNFDEVDTTELERIRKDSKDDYAAQGIKLTAMPFLVKSLAVALKNHPIVNASVSESGDEILYKEYVNIGVAVDTPRGLMVPVLKDADRKSIPQIAREIEKLAEAARAGSLGIEEMRGGTFTVSNLGAIGGTYSTPIINPPEAAILLVGRSRIQPQYLEGEFRPRMMMPLSLTYDHRIVDGAAAARFLNDVKKFLANPGRLLLAP
jgi:pyruvate dehydrogenase E2 component (dihydrolipoamide acetyltransferase)